MKSNQFKQRSDLAGNVLYLIVGVVFIATTFHGHGLLTQTQQFGLPIREFVTTRWESFYEFFEGSFLKLLLAVIGGSLLHYWILGCVFLISDISGWPSCITKYKVQPDQTTIPRDKLGRSLLNVVANQTVYSIPVLVGVYYAMSWRGCGILSTQLPTLYILTLEIAVCALVEEIGFYYCHRLLHHPSLYKTIHKTHHEWSASFAIVAFNCHPIEHIICNLLPAFIGPILMGSHLLTLTSWLIMAQTISLISHSGYHLPFISSPEFHDYHHLKFTGNYGVLGLLDRVHGTDENFRKTKHFQRHFTILGFTPAAQLIPDSS